VYDITTQLYSLNAHAGDAGGNLELYGFIYSWPKSLGEGVKVAHFSRQSNDWLSVPETGTTTLSENTTTKRLWTNLNQTDAIMIRIELHEVDDFPDTDDHYDVSTFEVPVSEIVTSVIQGQNYDKTPLRVTDQSNYIDFTMRFNYIMRRTSK
jgi:hypothetical protein